VFQAISPSSQPVLGAIHVYLGGRTGSPAIYAAVLFAEYQIVYIKFSCFYRFPILLDNKTTKPWSANEEATPQLARNW